MSIFASAVESGETERIATCAQPTTLHFTPLETFPNLEVTAPAPQTFVPKTYSRVANEDDNSDNQLSGIITKRRVHDSHVGSHLLGRFREKYENAMLPLGKALGNLGVSPNALSILAAVVALAAGFLYYQRSLLIGALVLLGSTFLDMLDGAVARAAGKASRFGAVLDHVLDRYVECIIVIGIVAGGFASWFWGLFALIGMLLASYSRAAAESVGGLDSCTIGMAERQEKLLLILAGSVLALEWSDALQYAMILVGLISHATVGQRLFYTWQNARTS